MSDTRQQSSFLPGGWSRSSLFVGAHVPRASRGLGYTIVTDDGDELIDLNNNFTTLFHGHGHPAVSAAAHAAIDRGVCFGLPTSEEEGHAARLVARSQVPDGVVRYANTGTEAVMMAVRLARAATGRDLVVFLEGAYHGWSDPALVASGSTLAGVPVGVSGDIATVGINDPDALEAVFRAEGHRIAALVVDLLPNRIGLVRVTGEWADQASQLCHLHGALLVVDEVVSFRLGWGGLHPEYGLSPDLVALGKTIGGGFAIGALLGRRDVMAYLDPAREDSLEHGGTFTANPLTLAAGSAALDAMTHECIHATNALGEDLRASLIGALEGSAWYVRGRGSLARLVPLVEDRRTARRLLTRLWSAALGRGLLLQPTGALCLSSPMDAAVVERVATQLALAITDTSGASVDDGKWR